MPAEAVQTAVEPAISTLSQTVIGSLLVLSWGITIASVYLLVKVQNSRVADQKEMSARLENTHAKMITAFEGFRGTLETLAKSVDMLIVGRMGGGGR